MGIDIIGASLSEPQSFVWCRWREQGARKGDKGGLWPRVRRLDLRWREQGARKGDKGGLWQRLDLRWREQGAKKGGLWLGREVRLEKEIQERWTVARSELPDYLFQ